MNGAVLCVRCKACLQLFAQRYHVIGSAGHGRVCPARSLRQCTRRLAAVLTSTLIQLHAGDRGVTHTVIMTRKPRSTTAHAILASLERGSREDSCSSVLSKSYSNINIFYRHSQNSRNICSLVSFLSIREEAYNQRH